MIGKLVAEVATKRIEVIEYIINVLRQRGSNYELIDVASLDEEDEDKEEFYALPRCFFINSEYAIIAVNIVNDELIFDGCSINREVNDESLFVVDDLSIETLLLVAGLIEKLES